MYILHVVGEKLTKRDYVHKSEVSPENGLAIVNVLLDQTYTMRSIQRDHSDDKVICID